MISHPFEPVIDNHSNILILGSFPSVKSREVSFYYGNKNNRFFKVLSNIFHEDFYHVDIETKKKLLSKYHIALFDVIKSCDIKGSSDSSITNVVVNDIEDLLQRYPIKKIIVNGNKAYELFTKYFPNLEVTLLPSTSSANAKYSLEELTTIYQKEILL